MRDATFLTIQTLKFLIIDWDHHPLHVLIYSNNMPMFNGAGSSLDWMARYPVLVPSVGTPIYCTVIQFINNYIVQSNIRSTIQGGV